MSDREDIRQPLDHLAPKEERDMAIEIEEPRPGRRRRTATPPHRRRPRANRTRRIATGRETSPTNR